MGDDRQSIRNSRDAAIYLAHIMPSVEIDNRLMVKSQVNCAVVYTGLPWHSAEMDCLRDIMRFGGILNTGHPGIHYAQLNENAEGVNTGTAFIGWVNRELAIASMTMFNGYRGNEGAAIEAMANRNGNPLHYSQSRRHGNPRKNQDVWEFPEATGGERGHIQSPFGAPTFMHNYYQLIEAGLVRST